MKIKVKLPQGKSLELNSGVSISQVLKIIGKDKDKNIIAAIVDNQVKEFNTKLLSNVTLGFVELDSADGKRIYQRSAVFILIKALHDTHPKSEIKILHPVSNGLFCKISGVPAINSTLINRLKKRMMEISKANIPFEREEVAIEKAIAIFKKSGKKDKAALLSYRTAKKASIYTLEDHVNYFYGYLAPSTGYIKHFSITAYAKGILLQLPSSFHPLKAPRVRKNKKLFEVFQETLKWRHILEVENVAMLNKVIIEDKFTEFVLIAEAFHEKKIAQIADTIASQKHIKVVFVSGPSASGKTTFLKRLAIQLRIDGFKPLLIPMDHYFIDRDKTPLGDNGKPDFESPNALNIALIQQNLEEIIKNKAIELPKYDFKTGKSKMSGFIIEPTEKSIILVEGIHGNNPLFSANLPRENIFKIYVSALTEVPLDQHNRIPTTTNRLLRRMIRDYQFRNYSATETILSWPLVRSGETKHVFPFQEEADVFFNTALIYELAVLKTMAEPRLKEVMRNSPAYAEAVSLLKFLSYFQPIPKKVVPSHSILREFLGGSSFEY